MSIRAKFKEESLNNMKAGNIESAETLEEVLTEEISTNFHNGETSKLAHLSRRYNHLCRKHTGKNLSGYLADLVAKDYFYIILNSKRSSMVVPAEDWAELYDEAMAQGDSAVEKLKKMYLEK